MLDTMSQCQQRLTEIQWPFLLIHGDVDKLTEISGSKLMQEKAASKDKTLKVRAGFELFFIVDFIFFNPFGAEYF